MLPKKQRLTGRAAAYVGRRGRKAFGPFLRIKWNLARDGISHATVVVSLTFDKRAIRRNRIKRQVREALRQFFPKIRPPVNLAVYVNKAARECSFQELRDELVSLLTRARLL